MIREGQLSRRIASMPPRDGNPSGEGECCRTERNGNSDGDTSKRDIGRTKQNRPPQLAETSHSNRELSRARQQHLRTLLQLQSIRRISGRRAPDPTAARKWFQNGSRTVPEQSGEPTHQHSDTPQGPHHTRENSPHRGKKSSRQANNNDDYRYRFQNRFFFSKQICEG